MPYKSPEDKMFETWLSKDYLTELQRSVLTQIKDIRHEYLAADAGSARSEAMQKLRKLYAKHCDLNVPEEAYLLPIEGTKVERWYSVETVFKQLPMGIPAILVLAGVAAGSACTALFG